MSSLESFSKELIEFAELFVNLEYKVWESAYTEKNSEIFNTLREKFNSKFFLNMETDARRKPNPSDLWFEEAKTYLSAIQLRKIFQLKIYLDKKKEYYGACYLSSIHQGGNNYFEMIIIKKIDNQFKVITSCLSDGEGYFDYHDGVEFDELPNPIKVIKFQPPSDLADLEEYNSE